MTTRNLTAAVGSVMAGTGFGRRLLVHVALNSETLYAQTGIGNLVVGTITYQGVGTFGGVERLGDDLERFSPGVKLWLSAVSGSNLFSEALAENLFHKNALVYRAFLQDGAVVNTPELWFRGFINEANLHRQDPERGDYLEVEARIRLKKEAKSSYWTREDLQLQFSGDTGFDYLDQIAGFKGLWGQQPTFFGRTTLGGPGDDDPFRRFPQR